MTSDGETLEARAAADLGGAAEGLLVRYDEPWRAYHTREHLWEMLTALDALLAEFRLELGLGPAESRTARLASWFHDAVYDPRRPDNEDRSADLARSTLDALGEPAALVDRVAGLVRATAAHRVDEADLAGMALMDADLWILAAPPIRYADYVRQVRREYAHVGDGDFAVGRRTVLTDLAGRERLYRTPLAHAEWEPRARRNIEAELEHMAS